MKFIIATAAHANKLYVEFVAAGMDSSISSVGTMTEHSKAPERIRAFTLFDRATKCKQQQQTLFFDPLHLFDTMPSSY
jgi:hypothetical protein